MEANNSSYFVLPALGKHYMFYGDALENCYLYEEEGLSDCICFVFNKELSESKDIDLRKLPGFLDVLDKKGKQVYVYSIPDEYLDDIYLFKGGKYSQMSDTYKQRVLSCNISATVKDIATTKIYGILYKTTGMRLHWKTLLGEDLPKDAECWSIPDLKAETFIKQ